MARPGSNGRRPRGYADSKRWRELAAAAERQPLAAWMRRYLDALLTLQFSPETVHKRCQDLAWFAQWCEERALLAPAEVTRLVMERYQRHLAAYRQANGKPLSALHQLSKLHSIKGLFRWLVHGHHLAHNPAADLVVPRVPQRRLPEPLTTEEIETALAMLDVEVPIELRDRAIWELLYSTGLRRAEALALHLSDVDRRRGTVFVRQGKGRKDRVVPIGERALAWLDTYLNEVRAVWADVDQPTLFVNPDGQPITRGTLTHRARTLLNRAGITKPGACHLFRHTMATQMLEHGADVRYVQEMLGHAHLNTTQVYTHVSIAKLKAVHTATHPGARLRRRERNDGEPT